MCTVVNSIKLLGSQTKIVALYFIAWISVFTGLASLFTSIKVSKHSQRPGVITFVKLYCKCFWGLSFEEHMSHSQCPR